MNRSSIMAGLSLLKECGYRVHGYHQDTDSATIWHSVLSSYSDEQLRKAFKSLTEGHTFNEVKPAHVVQCIRDNSFQGPGKGDLLNMDGWHRWHEEERGVKYEFAWHPSMGPKARCGCSRCHS